MASSTGLRAINRLITTHNAEGKAVFSDAVAPETPLNRLGQSGVLFGLQYCSDQFPVQMSEEKDVQTYQKYMKDPPGLVISTGTVLRSVGTCFKSRWRA